MPQEILTGFSELHWLMQAQYDALQEHNPYALYLISDRNRMYRGDAVLMDWFAVVDEFQDPYAGDLRPHTLCIRKSFDDGRTLLEARVLTDTLEWETLLPPVVASVDEDDPGGVIPTEQALVVYVTGKYAALKEYVDDIYARMEVSLQGAVAARASAESAASVSSAAAETSVDNSELAQSYSRGGTGARPGEDTDNARYYMELAASIANRMNTIAEVQPDNSHVSLQECIQTHVPNYDSDYTLPSVTDTYVLHKCVLEVLFSKASSADIRIADGTVLKHYDANPGAAVRFTCTWSNILSNWVVETLIMN